uniref:probable inactive receptor-like protein kinase At1g65250 n=1 Tax=Fragaria vesca subsp. vesca TaxID=101020 RepID=UPI0005CA4F2C|nr:PREDICTED: probable inactive receptor-like protein kinase At1g65250 [Fragaria vesca subsp. vesca]
MSSKVLFSLLSCPREEEIDTRSSSFLDNGSILLEDLIASCNGKYNPIRNYSADEIMRATNCFDPSGVMQKDSSYKMFQGFLDNRSVIVKKYFTVHWLAAERKGLSTMEEVMGIMSPYRGKLG